MPLSGKIVLAFGILSVGSFCIVWAFWTQDLRYALPTPRPANLKVAPLGQRLLLPLDKDRRPTLLVFYNPDCPCSRFNTEHVLALKKQYQDRVRFMAITQRGEAPQITTVQDPTGTIARTCGVYSTPQAVLLEAHGTLYYRGNFNRSRYCSEPKSEFARLAIEALLKGEKSPSFPTSATTAYGCALPE
jgi:hypothetical protein